MAVPNDNYSQEVLLIDVIQHYPFLYDKTLPDYKNNDKKDNAWDSIAEALQMTVGELQRVWRLLREKYSKERRINAKPPSGSAAAESAWPLYRAMQFMEKHIATRRRITNVSRPSSASEARSEVLPLSSPSCSSDSSVWSTYNTLAEDYVENETDITTEDTFVCEAEELPIETPPTPKRLPVEVPPTPKRAKTSMKSATGDNDQATESLKMLTNYLQQKQKPDRNMAFGQYVGLSLAEMPVPEQNDKILKIVEILKQSFE